MSDRITGDLTERRGRRPRPTTHGHGRAAGARARPPRARGPELRRCILSPTWPPLWAAASGSWTALVVVVACVIDGLADGIFAWLRARASFAAGSATDSRDDVLVREFLRTYLVVIGAQAVVAYMVFGGLLLKPGGEAPAEPGAAFVTWQYWAVVAGLVVMRGARVLVGLRARRRGLRDPAGGGGRGAAPPPLRAAVRRAGRRARSSTGRSTRRSPASRSCWSPRRPPTSSSPCSSGCARRASRRPSPPASRPRRRPAAQRQRARRGGRKRAPLSPARPARTAHPAHPSHTLRKRRAVASLLATVYD